MSGHERDEGVRPAQRAVDPGLAGTGQHCQDVTVVGFDQTSRTTARPAGHSAAATDVAVGLAARSMPTVSTGQH